MLHVLLLSLFIFSSCDHLPVKGQSVDKALEAVKLTGDGKGRLGMEQQNYLFDHESVLKENGDWILAAVIPVHGEEVMLLAGLKNATPGVRGTSAFETRIERGLREHFRKRAGAAQLARKFVQELRALMRFMLARELGLQRQCGSLESGAARCSLEGVDYEVRLDDKEISLERELPEGHSLRLEGQNLTGPFFGRTNFFFHSSGARKGDAPILSLELFWN